MCISYFLLSCGQNNHVIPLAWHLGSSASYETILCDIIPILFSLVDFGKYNLYLLCYLISSCNLVFNHEAFVIYKCFLNLIIHPRPDTLP